VECGICYAYRMEEEIPDEVCNDSRCQQAYHKSCLIEVMDLAVFLCNEGVFLYL